MVDDDFPTLWPGFAEELLTYLVSSDYQQLMGALMAFYEIAKKFQSVLSILLLSGPMQCRFKDLEERTAYDAMLELVLPRLHAIMVSLAQQPTPEHLLLEKMVLKIFYRSVEVCSLVSAEAGAERCSSQFRLSSWMRPRSISGCKYSTPLSSSMWNSPPMTTPASGPSGLCGRSRNGRVRSFSSSLIGLLISLIDHPADRPQIWQSVVGSRRGAGVQRAFPRELRMPDP
jgi:hypothetical protein